MSTIYNYVIVITVTLRTDSRLTTDSRRRRQPPTTFIYFVASKHRRVLSLSLFLLLGWNWNLCTLRRTGNVRDSSIVLRMAVVQANSDGFCQGIWLLSPVESLQGCLYPSESFSGGTTQGHVCGQLQTHMSILHRAQVALPLWHLGMDSPKESCARVSQARWFIAGRELFESWLWAFPEQGGMGNAPLHAIRSTACHPILDNGWAVPTVGSVGEGLCFPTSFLPMQM